MVVVASPTQQRASPGSSASEGIIEQSSSAHPETPQVDEDPFLRSLERKQVLFQQLWKGIAQLQHESGDSVHAWKAKLREIKELKNENADLSNQLSGFRKSVAEFKNRAHEMQEERDKSAHLTKRMMAELQETRLLTSKELEKAQRLKVQAEKRSHALGSQLENLSQQLEGAKRDLYELQSTSSRLTSENKSLKDDVVAITSHADDERKRLTKLVTSLQTEVADIRAQKDDASRHLWNVSDDVKKVKEKLEQTEIANRGLLAELEKANAKREKAAKKAKKHSDTLGEQLEDERKRFEKAQEELKNKNANLAEQLKSSKSDLKHVTEQVKSLQASVSSSSRTCLKRAISSAQCSVI